jgi:hypothetical protein
VSVTAFPFASADDAVDVSVELAAKPGTPPHEGLMWRNLARTLAWQRRQLRRVLADPRHLNRSERRVYSQAGEDGVIGEILRRAGETNRYFVEMGSGDGTENCTRALLEAGWRGCWIEADPRYAAVAEAIARGRVAVRNAMVDRANVVALLDSAAVPAEPDVLSVDVDGNDHWLWLEIARTRRPRVVVIEYNPRFPPPVRWALPYRADRMWDGSYRQGASLSALRELGARLGYRLVGCCSFGANAFFVRDDVARAAGSLPAVGPAEAYWPAAWNPGHFGHVALMEHRIGTLTTQEADQVLVTDGVVHSDPPVRVGQPVAYSLRIANRSRSPIGGGGVAGAFAVCEWVPAGAPGPGSWFRWGGHLQGLIRPGERRLLMGGWRAPDQPGEYVARIGLGLEPDGLAPGGSACCEVPVSVEGWPS